MEFLPVQWFKTLPSTNTYLREMAANTPGLPSGTTVAANKQTAGRGRFERQWQSSPGRDLTFSFFLRLTVPESWLPSLPMACALAVAEYLDHFELPAVTKWPNDVLVAGKKICGILTERTVVPGGGVGVIIGIGLNVNMEIGEASRIGKPATSIAIASGSKRRLPVAAVLAELLPHLATWIDKWEKAGFPSFRKEWEQKTVGLGQVVEIQGRAGTLTGLAAGFGESGELLLQDHEGNPHPVWSGDLVLPEAP